MAQSFFHQDFLRNIDLELFNQYLTSKNLSPPQITDTKIDDFESIVDRMVDYVDNFPESDRNAILSDFISVKELASDGGIQAVMDLSKDVLFKNNLSGQKNNSSRSLYCLTHKPRLFDESIKYKQLVSITNFHTRTGLKKLNADEVKKKAKELELELIAFLQKEESRGQECKIFIYEFDNRVCFFAYPADRPKTFDFYDKGKLDLGKVHRPSFKMIFVYYPDEGKIELSSRSQPKKRQKLFNLFNRVVLDDLKSVDRYQKVFNLDKLLDDDFQFILDPDYELDSVYVSEIRLDHNYLKKRYVVQIDKGEGVETIKEELKFRNLLGKNLEYCCPAPNLLHS